MLFLKAKLDATEVILRTLCAWLCRLIYPLISWLYTLFMDVTGLELLKSSEIQPIYERITLILAIVMVFYVTFEFVKYVVTPETMTDKEKGAGKIVYRMIAVVVLIAFVPKIFEMAYTVQTKVIKSEVISKVILGKSNVDSTTFGRGFSSQMLGMFYYYDEETWGPDEECDGIPCASIVSANLTALSEDGKLPFLNKGLNEAANIDIDLEDGTTEKAEDALIHFDGFFAVLVGGFIVYMLVLYCIDVGVRTFQLIYLQVIAPIPIIGFLSPKKDGIFQKWCKQCVTTYLDLFIRLSIIYFILLVSQTLLDSSIFVEFGDTRFFVKIALIMGLLVFANKAPKMLQELFPSMGAASGNFGLKAGERVAPLAARAIGATSGFANRLVRGGIERGINTAKQNKDIRNKLMEQGIDPSRKSVHAKAKENKKAMRTARNTYRQNKSELLKTLRDNNATAEDKVNKQNAYKQAKNKYMATQSAVADDKNNSYRGGAFLQGLAGSATGAVRGAKIGFGAKKIDEVYKKVQEGNKADHEANLARQKFIDAGGGSEFDRTIAGIEKTLGIRTAYERTESQINTLESRKKLLDSQAQMEAQAKSAQDAAKDRIGDKLDKGEQKVRLRDGEEIQFKDADGTKKSLEFTAGETTNQVYNKYKGFAETARSEADTANKIKTELEAQAAIATDPKEKETLEKKAKDARDFAEQKEKAYQDAITRQGQVKKALQEYVFTRSLQGNIPSEEIDDVLESKMSTVRYVESANRANPEVVKVVTDEINKRIANISNSNLSPEAKNKEIEKLQKIYTEFMENGATSYDSFDVIQGILTSHSGELKNQSNSISEEIRITKESSQTDAQKAANDNATGGSKK